MPGKQLEQAAGKVLDIDQKVQAFSSATARFILPSRIMRFSALKSISPAMFCDKECGDMTAASF